MLSISQPSFTHVDDQRAQRFIARPSPRPEPAVEYRFGGCQVRPGAREVLVNGVRRKLQPRPFDLLVYLIEQRHRVVSIDELLDEVWRDRDVQIGSLAGAIARIRSVLGDTGAGAAASIQTHHRVGYRFVGTLEDATVPMPA
jgi:DNA-binding winged helix-turn-helix (wHTH) protein